MCDIWNNIYLFTRLDQFDFHVFAYELITRNWIKPYSILHIFILSFSIFGTMLAYLRHIFEYIFTPD